MKPTHAVALALFATFSPSASAEDSLRPLDTRTRCISLFRECLVLIEKKDVDGIFSIIADGGGAGFKIFPDSPPREGELKDVGKFFEKNFRFNASTIKSKFNEILFSEMVTTDKSVSIKNKSTDEIIAGKLHSIKIKLPKPDVTAELRCVEVAGRLYWVPFGW
ncbi:MAG: hypothetical protein HN675_06815 [Opitutae bacterium]|jgi:hypothetical protein|nr:hypothetical protein [Opitutae bacterium]MBT5693109.1 hypothetical protein [Opitutae bacterium]MBT7853015.1 hypothetical protein [Opitutae bacterium]